MKGQRKYLYRPKEIGKYNFSDEGKLYFMGECL
jgi:hypothetical protein